MLDIHVIKVLYFIASQDILCVILICSGTVQKLRSVRGR